MKTWINSLVLFVALLATLIAHGASSPSFEWNVYQQAQSSIGAVNIIVSSEGYTAAEKTQFFADAKLMIDSIFLKEPFKTYQSHFNVFISWVPSNQSGVSISSTGGSAVILGPPIVYLPPGTVVDTAFKCVATGHDTSGNSIFSWDNDIFEAYAAAVPAKGDHIYLINTQIWAGGEAEVGGIPLPGTNSIVSVALVAKSALSGVFGPGHVALHELGHSRGGLGDEYLPVEPQMGPGVTYPNLALDIAKLPWTAWIDSGTPLPTPESLVLTNGAHTEAPEWYNVPGAFVDTRYTGYRPTFQSIMRGGSEFGPVNSEALVLAFYRDVGPLLSFSPNGNSLVVRAGKTQAFSATIWTAPATVSAKWYLDGALVSSDTAYNLQASSVAAGAHTVTLKVSDSTPFVRNDPKGLLKDEISWAVTTGSVPIITTQPVNVSVTAGQTASFSVVVDSGGAAVSYVWKKNGVAIAGANAASISLSNVVLGDAGSYSVVATTSDGTLTSNTATLTVTVGSSSSSSGGSSGGGGAVGPWAIVAFAVAYGLRLALGARKPRR